MKNYFLPIILSMIFLSTFFAGCHQQKDEVKPEVEFDQGQGVMKALINALAAKDYPAAASNAALADSLFKKGSEELAQLRKDFGAQVADLNQKISDLADNKLVRTGLIAVGAAGIVFGVVCYYLATQLGIGKYIGTAAMLGGCTSIGIAYFMPYGKFVGMVTGGAICVGLIVGAIYLIRQMITALKENVTTVHIAKAKLAVKTDALAAADITDPDPKTIGDEVGMIPATATSPAKKQVQSPVTEAINTKIRMALGYISKAA